MNIKGIPYTTVWVEYPNIAAVCKKIGASPTAKWPDGTPQYTLPAIFDPNTHTAVADSAAIVPCLDATYPATAALIRRGTAFQQTLWDTLIVPAHLLLNVTLATHGALNDAGEAYYRRSTDARGALRVRLGGAGPGREAGEALG